MNEIRITVHGNVVSEPVERQARNGSTYTTFRVATTPYRRTSDGRFVDGDTSFFDVIAFNALAANAATALRKGQPVIVEGNLSVKQYLSNDGTPRNSPQIDAAHIGHDLSWGRATFERVSRAAALGHDRTADPDVQASVRAMTEGPSGPSTGAPPTSTRTASSTTATTPGRTPWRTPTPMTTTCSRRVTRRPTTTRWSSGSRPEPGGGRQARTPIRCRARRQIAFCAWPSTSTP